MARPEFSENTYAFAVVHDIVCGAVPGINGTPIHPTRRAEGGPQGGYDVEIPRNPVPLFLQIKIPQVLTRDSKYRPPGFRVPYYRMHLRTAPRSRQHELLLLHAQRGRQVFYVTPSFHTLTELGTSASESRVWRNSRLFRPEYLGSLRDGGRHYVSYESDSQRWWISSEPRLGEADASADAFAAELTSAINLAVPEVATRNLMAEVADGLVETLTVAFQKELLDKQLVKSLQQLVSLASEYDPTKRAGVLAAAALDAQLVVVGRAGE